MRAISSLRIIAVITLFTASPSLSEEPVYFADANLKARVELALGLADPTPTDMLNLTVLNCYDSGIRDLTGLEYATNLAELDLAQNLFTDISHLAGLTNLAWLDLGPIQA